ncbi:uncharacterized protein LOC123545445 [Mercenaria mercenaria]|uniref:uncharacterized protein LOC123545445 n=1 Tax=Mercenaria mercenaria TaxID=6596 RepID=UPI00234EA379|nr:uncharacterized protein LOC123545445 [Mercenaria mercenaria]
MSLKRVSLSDTNLHSEMKIWRRNKMEDRKLALQNDMVDKHMAVRRKSYLQEQVSINKDFDKRFSKLTPTADEYLEKSQAKYSTWKERERERLDRKYRSLHKSYLNEYNKLGIKHYGPQKERNYSKSENQADATREDTENDTASVSFADEPMSEEEAWLALGKLNLDISRRRFSDLNITGKYPTSRRRGSTGSIDLAEFAKLRSLHLALTSVAEDAHDEESDDENERETDDKLEELNDITTRRKSVTIKEEPVEDVEVEDLIVRPKRRASIATTTIPKLPVKDSPIPLGKRFDRRPTLPNLAIPFNYGN